MQSQRVLAAEDAKAAELMLRSQPAPRIMALKKSHFLTVLYGIICTNAKGDIYQSTDGV